jgi:hypothetical protein
MCLEVEFEGGLTAQAVGPDCPGGLEDGRGMEG